MIIVEKKSRKTIRDSIRKKKKRENRIPVNKAENNKNRGCFCNE
jgi:heme exporter protein D